MRHTQQATRREVIGDSLAQFLTTAVYLNGSSPTGHNLAKNSCFAATRRLLGSVRLRSRSA